MISATCLKPATRPNKLKITFPHGSVPKRPSSQYPIPYPTSGPAARTIGMVVTVPICRTNLPYDGFNSNFWKGNELEAVKNELLLKSPL